MYKEKINFSRNLEALSTDNNAGKRNQEDTFKVTLQFHLYVGRLGMSTIDLWSYM